MHFHPFFLLLHAVNGRVKKKTQRNKVKKRGVSLQHFSLRPLEIFETRRKRRD